LNLDNNLITHIEGLKQNVNLRVLSLNGNNISDIENLDGLFIEELYLSTNHVAQITGLNNLPVLHTLDLSKNEIERLRGLEQIETLRFLNLSLNQIRKVT
jgi:Leucine-rich repeat (LRR) protein